MSQRLVYLNGPMTFGTPVREPEAVAIVHRALDLGVNFIGIANMYEGYARYVGSPGRMADGILAVVREAR